MASQMDSHFGPQLAGHFDFTLLFEQAIFEIAPNSLLVLATPYFLKTFASRPTRQMRGPLFCAKMFFGALLIAFYITKAVLSQRASEYYSEASVACSVMSIIASICAFVILYIAHACRRTPSTFISLFFSLTILLDTTLARSYYLRYRMGLVSMNPIAVTQTVIVLLKLWLVVLEEVPKRRFESKRTASSRLKCDSELGFWGKVMFFSVNSLLLFGYKNEITVEDLHQIDEKLDSRVLFDAFFAHWSNMSRSGKFVLLRACLRTILTEFLSMILPRLLYVGFSLSRPFLIQRVLEIVGSGNATYQHATGLVGATVLVYAGIAISRSVYERIGYRVKVSIRGMLTVALYDKMQKLSANEPQSAAAITLMTTDVMGVEQIIALLHEVWATCLELAFGIYILYMLVNVACFLIFIPSILATISTYYCARNMAKARRQWNEKISERIQATSTVLKQLREIKAMGLSHCFSSLLQEKRREEVHVSLRERRSRVIMFATSAFNLSLTPVIVIAGARFWTRSTPTMTAAEIFSTYAIILITSEPLDSLLQRAIMWASSYACITRVQNYLSLPEMEDARLVEETKEKGSDLDDKIHRPLPEGSDTVAIRMEAVNVGSDNGRSILNNVSLSIPAGSLVMVRGTVGSGKSIFLQAILGEIKPIKGSISVFSKDISFAAQNPWIRNQTVRENITGPNTVAESIYEEIIYCCALDADIAEFPCGSETMTGTDGCNLSGGQKQRLGLARSLCTTASIVILDDVLSALDSPTAATVFDRLLGPGGLLRRRGTTVIMTTNTVELFPAADLILDIMADGTINQQQGEKLHPPLVIEAAPTAATLDKDASSSVPRNTNIKPTASSAATDVGQTRQKRDLGLYAYLFRSAGPLLLSLWIVSIAFASVAEKMPKIFVQIWYTIAPEDNTYFAGFVLSACANILITAAATLFYFILIVPELSNELHWRLLSTTVGSTLAWIAQTDTGTSLNRFSQDISIISQQLPISFLQFTFILFNTLVDIGIFATGAKYTAPIMLMLLFALYGVQYFYLRTSRQLRILDLETSAPLLTLFNETSTGIQHVRAFQWQGQFMDECCRLVDRMQKPYYGLLSVQQWLAFVLDMSTCFIATILIAVSTALPSSTSEASIGLALVNLVSFSVMTSALIRVWVTFETCLGGLARIRTFCATTPQETDAPADTSVPGQWPMSGRIDIESVSASYTYEDGTVHQALSNVSIVIKHGEKVCISGRTGSGKSSLFLALLRMIECSGTIRIDGRDISTIPREVLRSRITTLTQDGVEVDQSVRFNMYPFDENKPTDDAILEMLNLVGLGPHVLSQGGIDAKMSSMKFSSGQKQLFFIARGVLHHKNARTKIVMMDEATSSIDSIFDEQIQKLMHEQLKDCTLILISHRLHSLGTVDMVVKLDAGSIADVTKRNPASA